MGTAYGAECRRWGIMDVGPSRVSTLIKQLKLPDKLRQRLGSAASRFGAVSGLSEITSVGQAQVITPVFTLILSLTVRTALEWIQATSAFD
jgi:hypothetical protein